MSCSIEHVFKNIIAFPREKFATKCQNLSKSPRLTVHILGGLNKYDVEISNLSTPTDLIPCVRPFRLPNSVAQCQWAGTASLRN